MNRHQHLLTREGHVSENGGTPSPPQRQQAALNHGRADAHPQLAVGQLPGLHFSPDELQRADDGHRPHWDTKQPRRVNERKPPGRSCGRELTSGQSSGEKRDVAALQAHAELQGVPQLVVAGEVDDGGGDRHDPTGKWRFEEQVCATKAVNIREKYLTVWKKYFSWCFFNWKLRNKVKEFEKIWQIFHKVAAI